MGDVGQIQLVQANIRFPESVDAALEGADAVINLVGVMHDKGKQSFDAIHTEGARTIAEAAAKRGIKRFVQFSAIGAAPKGARYARTKYAGERAVLEAVPTATIMRPSIIFGPEDTFFNRFGAMMQTAAALVPIVPMPGAKTKFQPVFVGDVADAVVAALESASARGRVYELGGPNTYTFRELLNFTRAETERRVMLAPLPFVFAHPFALLLSWAFALIPFADPPLTGDQVTMLKRDNVVGDDPTALTIQDLGVTQLESVEAIAPTYLWRFRPYGQFQTKQNPA